MLNNLTHTFHNNRIIVYFILVFFLYCFLIVSSFLFINKIHFYIPDLSSSFRTPILLLVFGYGMIMFLLLGLSIRTGLVPVRKLLKNSKSLISGDMASFSNAIVELSQGNLSKKLSTDIKPLESTDRKGLNELTGILNEMIRSLNDMAGAYNSITNVPCRRLFYVGADSFLEGRRCGELMGEYLNGRGKVIITAETFKAANLDLRRRGFLNAVKSDYPDIEIIAEVEARAGQNHAYTVFKDVLKKYRDISGIYIACGSPPPQVARAVVEAKREEKIKIICHDLMDDTMRWIKDCVITATLSQNTYAQGFDPVVHMYNHLVAGWAPPVPYLLTELEVVNYKNYNSFWQEGKGVLVSDNARKKLARPMPKASPEPVRIAVLGRDDTAFWQAVAVGQNDSIALLKSQDVIIDLIIPEKVRIINDITTDIYGPVIDEIIEKKYNGLVTMAPNADFVPYIHKAVDAGIPVGLFNSDPTSLRGLIYTITDQAYYLLALSENLADNTDHTSQATVQIKNTMNDIAQGAKSQNDQVTVTRDAIRSLLNNIDNVSKDATRSAEATEDTTKAVQWGTEAMSKTISAVTIIDKSLTGTSSVVKELRKHSNRIDAVVDIINSIASRVNVLALNAAIEATKAGQYGKGFSIVASEIRKLAKNTATATKEVAELVTAVKTDIIRMERTMSEGIEKVKQSSDLTDNTMKVLGDIQDRVEVDKRRMQNIHEAMVKMQDSSNQVGHGMENVSSASEKNLMSVENVNTLTSAMTEQLNNVTRLAKSLEIMAQGEQEMLAKFRLMEEKTEQGLK